MNHNCNNKIISFLYHRATDYQDAQAYEILGDLLATGEFPSSLINNEITSSLTYTSFLPSWMNDKAIEQIPPPPYFLTQEYLPNIQKAIEFYQEAALLGRSHVALKLATLVSTHDKKRRKHNNFIKSTDYEDVDEHVVPDEEELGFENDDDYGNQITENEHALVEKLLDQAVNDHNVQAIHFVANKVWKESEEQSRPSSMSLNPTLMQKRSMKANEQDQSQLKSKPNKVESKGDSEIDTTINKKRPLRSNSSAAGKSKAFRLWLKAAEELHDITAMKMVAECYREGIDTLTFTSSQEEDYFVNDSSENGKNKLSNTDKFLIWQEKAYNLGDSSVLLILAEGYRLKMMDINGKKPNQNELECIDKALEFTKKATEEMSDPKSMLILGHVYAFNEHPWSFWNLGQDYSIAVHYFLEAYDHGQDAALNLVIGILYQEWKNINQKYRKSHKNKQLSTSSKNTLPQGTSSGKKFISRKQLNNHIQQLTSQFNINSSHIHAILVRMRELINEHGYRLRIKSTGEPQDIFKAFIKIEENIGHLMDNEVTEDELEQ